VAKTQEIGDTWLVFIFGFIGGLLALLNALCVSNDTTYSKFFLPKEVKIKKGVFRAVLYGFFYFLDLCFVEHPFSFWYRS
jgi:hypothetical protein